MMLADAPEKNDPREPTTKISFHPVCHSVRPPWSLRDLGLFVVFVPFALLASNLLALALYAALKPLMGWAAAPQVLRENAFFLLMLQSIFHAFLLAYIYLLVVVNYRQPFWAALNWRKLSLQETLGFLAGGVVLALVVRFAPTLLPNTEDFPLQRLLSSAAAAYALGAFAILIAPLMEELIFRGLLFRFFEHHAGGRFAVVSTALLFAGLHVPEYWGAWNHVLLIALVGVAFSLARGVTGSLAASYVLHLAYNASLMVALFFQTQQFRTLPLGV